MSCKINLVIIIRNEFVDQSSNHGQDFMDSSEKDMNPSYLPNSSMGK